MPYAVCSVHKPLAQNPEKNLAGVLGRNGLRTAAVAPADDVTIFVTKPRDFRVIREAVRLYGKASGACLNIRNSKVLLTGGLEKTANLGADFHPTIRILGITFSSTTDQAMHESWA